LKKSKSPIFVQQEQGLLLAFLELRFQISSSWSGNMVLPKNDHVV
jgi:hypothetical protein